MTKYKFYFSNRVRPKISIFSNIVRTQYLSLAREQQSDAMIHAI